VLNTSGQAVKADANASGLWTGAFAVAVTKASSGETVHARAQGAMTNTSWSWSAPRVLLYSSTTPGQITETKSTGAQVVGISLSATSMYFKPYQLPRLHKTVRMPNAATGANWYAFSEDAPAEIVEAHIIADTPTAGSNAGKYWQFTLYNLTTSTIVAQADTFNNGEIVADTPWSLGTISSPYTASHDVVEMQALRVGGPTPWTGAEVMALVEAFKRI
jgi:hypothetical protein